jgi:hypothetical protein
MRLDTGSTRIYISTRISFTTNIFPNQEDFIPYMVCKCRRRIFSRQKILVQHMKINFPAVNIHFVAIFSDKLTVKKGFPPKFFPVRESLVSNIPAGDGKIVNLFLQCYRILAESM